MPELTEDERERLAELREKFGDVEVTSGRGIRGELGPLDPMLADVLHADFDTLDEDDWLAEVKYDGTRIILQHIDSEVRAYTRKHVDRADDIPTIRDAATNLPGGVILDGELTFVNPQGVSTFQPIHTSQAELERRELTPVYYVFDVLYRDSEDLTDTPLIDRKAALERLVEETISDPDTIELAPYRTSDFSEFYREQTDAGEEGLIVKRRESHYYPGVRSEQWLKVKRFTERDAIVVGYTEGKGDRADTFGSLVLSDGEQCIGRVGTGFTEDELAEIAAEMEKTDDRPFTEDEAGAPYTPVEPFVVTVKYQELTSDGKLRAPVYLGQQPEKPLADVQPISR